jgi:hypothetical protein
VEESTGGFEMTRNEILEAAKQVWSAGDMYIGPSVESLEAFTTPLLKRVAELETNFRVEQIAHLGLTDLLEKQLAAAQAENVKLREALEDWRRCDLDEEQVDRLLSKPTDTSALQAAIDAAYERAADLCASYYEECAKYVAPEIRKLKGTS